ncbi:MAG: acylphosphatase [Planctomycetota bacterium]|nr:MAG: acylphosphatase [Planctomycetota bacterium]
MPDADEPIRCTVLYSGTVQGVGFRFMTERVAREFKVTGTVRNLPDGQVEVVAEGDPSEIHRFLAGIDEAMSGYIRDRQISREPATGEFRDFSIRF